MIPMPVAEIAGACHGRLQAGRAETVVDRVVIDSREVGLGACFFAIRGARTDGHEYLQAAIEAGAAAVVIHRDPGRSSFASGVAIIEVEDTTVALQLLAAFVRTRVDPLVVAITGSIGKTSTKHFAASLLAPRWDVYSTPGNLNNHWGLPLSLLGLEPHHEVMVAELAMSGPGEIRALARIARPQVGVITNVAPVHMEFFNSIEGVASAKAELAEELSSTGTLIVNGADPRTLQMGDRFRASVGRVLTYGTDAGVDVQARDAFEGGDGWTLVLDAGEAGSVPVVLPLTGEHTLMNFLAAATIARALDVDLETIAVGARRLDFPSGRGGTQDLENGARIIDDSYNASPVAMKRSIDRLAGLPASKRRILAAGDMLELGSWSEEAHRDVGTYAARQGIDLLFVVGQFADSLAAGAESGGMPAERISCFATAEEAGRALLRVVEAGDLVLVKGSRGVHMERIIEAMTAKTPTSRHPAEG